MTKFSKTTGQKDLKYVQILGIDVLSTSISELLTSIRQKISYNEQFTVLTPNPELLLLANKDAGLKNIINSASFAVPDGIGLKYAAKFLYGKPLSIIPGRILFTKLIELADRNGWKVFFLGGKGAEAQKASEQLRKTYKKIRIEVFKGPGLDIKGKPVTDLDKGLLIDTVDKINKFVPDLLFVAFGNPKQEIWIHDNLSNLKVKGVMAVGGTFRYIAGISKLPPSWVEKTGLEWVWRLVTEPKRIVRIANAVIIFPFKVLIWKIAKTVFDLDT